MAKQLFSLLLLFPLLTMAQVAMVVNDPSANAKLLQQVTEAGKQTSQLQESVNELKKSTDLYYKVNSYIKQADLLKSVLATQTSIITQSGQALQTLQKRPGSIDAMNQFRARIDGIVTENKQNLEIITQVLQEGILKMTDGDRLTFLMSMRERMEKLQEKLGKCQSAYNTYVSMRDFIKKHY